MNRVEERLTAAYQAAAETVIDEPELPDLTAAGGTRIRPCTSSRARLIRLASPLAAAAAVAAVAVTLSLIATSGPGPAQHRPSGPLPWRLPAATSVRQGYPGNRIPVTARPGYFVGLQPARHGPTEYAFAVSVYSATTGRETGVLTLPAGQWAQAVTSIGSGTYVVAATRDWPRFGCRTWLYQFRLSTAGQPAGLKPFVMPQARGWAWQLAGSKRALVLTTMKCGRGHTEFMNVRDDLATKVSLPSGRPATWSPWPAASHLVPENEVPSAALDASGRLLPFVAIAVPDATAGFAMGGYAMRTGHVAGTASRRYHLVLKPSAGVLSAVLSPDGRVTFALTARRYGGRWHETIGAYATASGKQLTVLATASARYEDANGFLYPDPSGRYLLALGFGAGNTAVLDIKTHKLSAVPVPYRYPPLAATW